MPKLALSMIVRDASSTLAACLSSAKDIVDEIVIADTGSTDRTPEIAGITGPRSSIFRGKMTSPRLEIRPSPQSQRTGSFRSMPTNGSIRNPQA